MERGKHYEVQKWKVVERDREQKKDRGNMLAQILHVYPCQQWKGFLFLGSLEERE